MVGGTSSTSMVNDPIGVGRVTRLIGHFHAHAVGVVRHRVRRAKGPDGAALERRGTGNPLERGIPHANFDILNTGNGVGRGDADARRIVTDDALRRQGIDDRRRMVGFEYEAPPRVRRIARLIGGLHAYRIGIIRQRPIRGEAGGVPPSKTVRPPILRNALSSTRISIFSIPVSSSVADTLTLGISSLTIPSGELALITGGVVSTCTVNLQLRLVTLPALSVTSTATA